MSARNERGSASIWAVLVIAGAFTVLLGLVVDGGRVIDARVAASRAAAQAARAGADALSSASVRNGNDAIDVEAAMARAQSYLHDAGMTGTVERRRRHRHRDGHRRIANQILSIIGISPSRSTRPNPPEPSPRRTRRDRDPPCRDRAAGLARRGRPHGPRGGGARRCWWRRLATRFLTAGPGAHRSRARLCSASWPASPGSSGRSSWSASPSRRLAEIRLATGRSADWLARVPGTFGGQQSLARTLVQAVVAIGATTPPRPSSRLLGSRTPMRDASPSPARASPCSWPRPRSLPTQQAAVKHRSQLTTEVVVARGDTLWSIAERHLGAGERWREIAELNRGREMVDGSTFDDARTILPGWTLLVPSADTSPTANTRSSPSNRATPCGRSRGGVRRRHQVAADLPRPTTIGSRTRTGSTPDSGSTYQGSELLSRRSARFGIHPFHRHRTPPDASTGAPADRCAAPSTEPSPRSRQPRRLSRLGDGRRRRGARVADPTTPGSTSTVRRWLARC